MLQPLLKIERDDLSYSPSVFFLCFLVGILGCGESHVKVEAPPNEVVMAKVRKAREQVDLDVTIALLRDALEKWPHQAMVRIELAKALGDRLHPEDGLAVLDSGTLPETMEQKRPWLELLAGLAQQAGDRERAISAHNALIENGLATWRNHAALGDLHRRTGQFNQALSFYRRALAANPGHGPTRIARALCFIRTGQDLAARDALIEDLQRFPHHPTLTLIACRLLACSVDEAVRNPSVALNLIAQLEKVPQTAEWLDTRAMVAASLDEFSQAVAFQRQALRLARSIEQNDLAGALAAKILAYEERRNPHVVFRSDDPIFYASSYESLFGGRENLVRTGTVPELLRKIAKTADPSQNSFLNSQLAAGLEAQLGSTDDINRRLELLPTYGQELLRAGQTRKALAAYSELKATLSNLNTTLDDEQKRWLWDQLGVANLRLAEQENCLTQHHAEACILPLRGNGIHQSKTGSMAAVSYFQKVLEFLPHESRAKWLHLVATMTLGQSPEVLPELFETIATSNETDEAPAPFTNVAHEWGVAVSGLSGGTVVEDFDGDGLLDIMVSSWGLADPIRYFRNSGYGFEDRTAVAGLAGQWSGLNMMQTDFDNDGFADVLVLRGAWLGAAGQHPNSLLRNNGDGTFSDVTRSVGLLSFRPTQTAVWQDFDGDGWVDVFIGNESSGEDRFPCEFYRNMGNGTFEEIAAPLGLAIEAFVKGVTAGDVDGDGRPDLYLSCFSESNKLLLNKPAANDVGFEFVDVTESSGVGLPIYSFPTWFWDYDNDGWLDLFVSDYSSRDLDRVYAELLGRPIEGETTKLYKNRGDGTFQDVTETMGLNKLLVGMGANFGDLDNDGFLDIYVGNGTPDLGVLIPNRVFRNLGGARMRDITMTSGMAHLQKGHAVAFGDLDNDGDQDVYITLGGAYQGDVYPNALFRNHLADSAPWLKLELNGRTANRKAIGARIEIGGQTPRGPARFYRTVGSGGSFGASPLRQEIGLGEIQGNVNLIVTWPGGGTDVYEDVEPNAAYRVVEGEKTLHRLSLPKFVPPKAGMAHGDPP